MYGNYGVYGQSYKDWFDKIPYEVREDALRTNEHEMDIEEFMSKHKLKPQKALEILTAVRVL